MSSPKEIHNELFSSQTDITTWFAMTHKLDRPRTFVIAEAGVNHNGSVDLALRLVDAATDAGADAVKFQTFSADKLVVKGVQKAEYQKVGSEDTDQHSMLKNLEMTATAHRAIVAHCEDVGIQFLSTPFDREAADFLISIGMRKIKIASGEITNEPFLKYLASKNLPLILSTGMSTMAEIDRAVQLIRANRRDEAALDWLTLLHCTSNYPAACADVNLKAMRTMARQTGLPVGYSDHTQGLAVSTAAVALGATVIEKHFTLDRNLKGPDHQASLTPDELAQLITQIRDVEMALGSEQKSPTASEMPIRALVRRSVIAIKHIPANANVTIDDLDILRPGTGISPGEIDNVVGKVAACEITAGTILQWSLLK